MIRKIQRQHRKKEKEKKLPKAENMCVAIEIRMKWKTNTTELKIVEFFSFFFFIFWVSLIRFHFVFLCAIFGLISFEIRKGLNIVKKKKGNKRMNNKKKTQETNEKRWNCQRNWLIAPFLFNWWVWSLDIFKRNWIWSLWSSKEIVAVHLFFWIVRFSLTWLWL